MDRPTLSVGLCNYNHGHLVGRALDAIVHQSHPPDELILIDDGSTDNSLEVVEPYVERYPFVRFVRNEKNRGAHEAALQAIKLATCDFHYSAAADDLVLPGAFEAAMRLAAKHPEVGIVFGPMQVVRPDGSDLGTTKARSWQANCCVTPEMFLHEYLEVEAPDHSLSPSTIYRRGAWEKIGFYRVELGHWADTFSGRALGLMHGAAYVGEPIAMWTLAEDTFSGRARSDPHTMLDVVSRAAWLMRSEPFRKCFPERHVESWSRRYRALIAKRAGRRFKRELQRRLEDPSGRSDPLPLRLLADLAIRVISRAAMRSLMRYRGDLSCYEAEGSETRVENRAARARASSPAR